MFSSKSQPAAKQQPKKPVGRDNAVTILTSGCHFSGKLYCRGATRIGGKVEGQIISEGLLIVEEDAVINAEVKADEVIIQGQVTGKLTATGRVELTNTSKFEGDIATPSLVVREGAQFNGRSTMIKRAEDATSKSPRVITGGKNSKNSERTPDFERDNQRDVAVLKVPEVNLT